MKILLTGASGFAGGEVLRQLLLRPDIEQVTCLVRRPLSVEHPKLLAVVHRDFCQYPSDLVRGHGACVWTLGGKASDFQDTTAYAQVTHDFPLALAGALAGTPVRFCYLSGMGADPSERAWLPWERETRHLKGRTERDLQALAASRPRLSVFCFRAGGILPDHQRRLRRWLAPISVSVSELARAMIRIALHGGARSVLSNREIQRLA